MGKLKVGVIGTGFIGPVHIEAAKRTGLADVVALADVNSEVANAKAKDLNIPKAYGDYKELLADESIDIMHICTPNNLHFQMSKEALEAGKHVLCEKPLAMNSDEASELIKIAAEKGLVNAIHFNIRFYPLIHQAKAMIESGEIGEVLAVNGSYLQDWLFYDTDYNWRLEPQFSGDSRAIADIGSHWFDAVEFITGLKVEKVCADFATFHEIRKKPLKSVETYSGKMLKPEDYADVKIDTEDYATVLLRFSKRAHGSLTVNQVAAGRKNRLYFEISGSKKAIVFNSERCNELWVGNRDQANHLLMRDPSLLYEDARNIISYPGGHNEGFADTSKQMLRKLYQHILDGGKGTVTYPTFDAGRRELLLCEKIVESARAEAWKSID